MLFGFLASRVWANHEHAENYVAQEASALHEIVLMAPAFPPDVQTRLLAAVRAHIKAMAEEEWPAMARGEKDVGRTPRVLTEATAMVLGLDPTRPGEQLAQQRVVAAMDEALDARRNRIMLSGDLIDGVQWGVILVLMILILTTVAMGNVESPRASAVAMFIVATASAASLVLLLAYDQPLNAAVSLCNRPCCETSFRIDALERRAPEGGFGTARSFRGWDHARPLLARFARLAGGRGRTC